MTIVIGTFQSNSTRPSHCTSWIWWRPSSKLSKSDAVTQLSTIPSLCDMASPNTASCVYSDTVIIQVHSLADAVHPVTASAALLLQWGSCLPFLPTWSLPLIIINKYDDGIVLYPCWKRDKAGRWERKTNIVGKKTGPSAFVCILFLSVPYPTDTVIKTVVKRWYNVHMTVYKSCSGLLYTFCLITHMSLLVLLFTLVLKLIILKMLL